MHPLDIAFLNNLKDDFKNYNTFIETGTYLGGTILNMEEYFNELYTIELNEKLYNNIKTNYKGDKIKFLLGDSSLVFPNILPNINNDAIFYLDGHWSSGITSKGDKDCPLMEELSTINSCFKKKGIIIIDDCRLFGKGPETGLEQDWTAINTEDLVNKVKDRVNNIYYLDSVYSKNDRLVIHITDKA